MTRWWKCIHCFQSHRVISPGVDFLSAAPSDPVWWEGRVGGWGGGSGGERGAFSFLPAGAPDTDAESLDRVSSTMCVCVCVYDPSACVSRTSQPSGQSCYPRWWEQMWAVTSPALAVSHFYFLDGDRLRGQCHNAAAASPWSIFCFSSGNSFPRWPMSSSWRCVRYWRSWSTLL